MSNSYEPNIGVRVYLYSHLGGLSCQTTNGNLLKSHIYNIIKMGYSI